MPTVSRILIASLTLLATTACGTSSDQKAERAAKPEAAPVATAKAVPDHAAVVERGKYLVTTSGCEDCHTPLTMTASGPAPDPSRRLSGHPEGLPLPPPPAVGDAWNVAVAATMTAWTGPWGTSFTANLTPDKDTGLGTWTEEMFVATVRNGRHLGTGRPLLPPMPPTVAQFTDEDLHAIFAYLQSLPPVKNRVPDPLPPARS